VASQMTGASKASCVLDSDSEDDAGPPAPGMNAHMLLSVRDGGTIHLIKSEVDKCGLLKRLGDDVSPVNETVNIPFSAFEINWWRQGVHKGAESLSTRALVYAVQVSQSPLAQFAASIEARSLLRKAPWA
jgi:hypothetical protein